MSCCSRSAPLDSFTSRGDQFEHVESCGREDMASSTDALTDAQEVEDFVACCDRATLGQSLISQRSHSEPSAPLPRRRLLSAP